MLDSKKSLKKINFIYCLICVMAVMFYNFGVKWNETQIINQLPLMNNTILTPLINTINTFVGDVTLSTSIVAIITYILSYYLLVVFPISLWHFVKGAFGRE